MEKVVNVYSDLNKALADKLQFARLKSTNLKNELQKSNNTIRRLKHLVKQTTNYMAVERKLLLNAIVCSSEKYYNRKAIINMLETYFSQVSGPPGTFIINLEGFDSLQYISGVEIEKSGAGYVYRCQQISNANSQQGLCQQMIDSLQEVNQSIGDFKKSSPQKNRRANSSIINISDQLDAILRHYYNFQKENQVSLQEIEDQMKSSLQSVFTPSNEEVKDQNEDAAIESMKRSFALFKLGQEQKHSQSEWKIASKPPMEDIVPSKEVFDVSIESIDLSAIENESQNLLLANGHDDRVGIRERDNDNKRVITDYVQDSLGRNDEYLITPTKTRESIGADSNDNHIFMHRNGYINNNNNNGNGIVNSDNQVALVARNINLSENTKSLDEKYEDLLRCVEMLQSQLRESQHNWKLSQEYNMNLLNSIDIKKESFEKQIMQLRLENESLKASVANLGTVHEKKQNAWKESMETLQSENIELKHSFDIMHEQYEKKNNFHKNLIAKLTKKLNEKLNDFRFSERNPKLIRNQMSASNGKLQLSFDDNESSDPIEGTISDDYEAYMQRHYQVDVNHNSSATNSPKQIHPTLTASQLREYVESPSKRQAEDEGNNEVLNYLLFEADKYNNRMENKKDVSDNIEDNLNNKEMIHDILQHSQKYIEKSRNQMNQPRSVRGNDNLESNLDDRESNRTPTRISATRTNSDPRFNSPPGSPLATISNPLYSGSRQLKSTSTSLPVRRGIIGIHDQQQAIPEDFLKNR